MITEHDELAEPGFDQKVGRGRSLFLAVIWAVPLVFGFGLWTFSSPVGANPDEPSHIIYAWSIATGQGFGDRQAKCEPSVKSCPPIHIVKIPVGLFEQPGCYAFRPNVPAACSVGRTSGDVVGTNMVRYPPLYYGVIGLVMRSALAVGVPSDTTGFLARLASALISITLIAPALALAWARARRLVPGLILLLTPMSLFMVGAINPSGVEITAAMAAATAIVVLARSSRQRPAQVLLTYAITWLTWSRPLGFLWAATIVAFGLFYIAISDSVVRQIRQLFRDLAWVIGFAVVNLMGGVMWFAYASQVRNVGGDGPKISLPAPGLERHIAIFLRWGEMIWEDIGVLGWLDTRLPLLLMLATVVTLTSVVNNSIFKSDVDVRRRLLAFLYLLAIFVGTTLIMYYQGFLWQGRYVLPALAAGYLLLVGASKRFNSHDYLGSAVVGWAIGVFGAVWLYSRHAYGIEVGSRYTVPNVSGGAQWLGPLGNYRYLTFAIVAMASLPTVLLLLRRKERGSGDRSQTAEVVENKSFRSL